MTRNSASSTFKSSRHPSYDIDAPVQAKLENTVELKKLNDDLAKQIDINNQKKLYLQKLMLENKILREQVARNSQVNYADEFTDNFRQNYEKTRLEKELLKENLTREVNHMNETNKILKLSNQSKENQNKIGADFLFLER